ncbi:nucleotide pyrophosphohydrolase [Candidatus Woesearchaeota archaeon]|nr:nucleotide pyrophosphohydrolase [Candidatus Woesearchaeota archaeon]MBW3021772.1 nucleotide pyrophosphohydrolase [Candidatus Woesearchaeota archaeon]
MTDFNIIQEKLREFNEERNWIGLKPKELLIALMSEVGELADCYRWLSHEDVEKLHIDPEKRKKVEEEIADIFIYLIHLCRESNIDIVKIIDEKIEKNRLKYPVDLSKDTCTNKFFGRKG